MAQPDWRGTRADPALELFLPQDASLSDLDPNLLAPNVLPSLWSGDTIKVTDAIAYFAGDRIVNVQREGYEEPVAIPACLRENAEAAILAAVHEGGLWLVNGPASFQGEPVPPGILADTAQLRAPMHPLAVDRLTKDAVPGAWENGRTSALALSAALSVQAGAPLPWPILRRAIDDAVKSRWLELASDASAWPCDAAGASAVTLTIPERKPGTEIHDRGFEAVASGIRVGAADLEPHELQDVVDAVPDLIKASAGLPLRFHVRITLGGGDDVPAESASSLNEILEGIRPELRLRE